MEGKYFEKNPFPTSAFVLYVVIATGFLATYVTYYTYVFSRKSSVYDSTQKRCCDPMRYGLKTCMVLSFPILANAIHLLDACISLFCYLV